MKMIDHKILVLRLESHAAEFKLKFKRASLILTNSIIIYFSKGTKLLVNLQ